MRNNYIRMGSANKKKLRLNRSQLAVPGTRTEFFQKAAQSDADIIFLDLEDSVSFSEKLKARNNIIQAINDINWKNKTLSVRVNSFDSSFIEEDINQILRKTSSRLDLLLFPKINSANEVIKLEKLISNYEKIYKRDKQLGFELIIETSLGLINIKEIALASSRNEALHFGAADFAASIGAKTTNIGGVNKNYGVLDNTKKNFFINDMWHYVLFKIVLIAHAYGLRAIDCPYGDFSDDIGFKSMAKSSYTMGFDGKMVIHPSQIKLANEIYSPTSEEIREAKEIILQMRKAEKKGKGAIAFKGKLLDIVSIKQANRILEIKEMIKEGKKI